jgi:hypothetical protein
MSIESNDRRQPDGRRAAMIDPGTAQRSPKMRGAAPKKLCLRHLAARAIHVPALSALSGVLERSKVAFGSRHPGNLGIDVAAQVAALVEPADPELGDAALAQPVGRDPAHAWQHRADEAVVLVDVRLELDAHPFADRQLEVGVVLFQLSPSMSATSTMPSGSMRASTRRASGVAVSL